MTTLLKHPGKYEEGFYGVVFFDGHGYAIKVFKRRVDVPEEHVFKVFQSEVDAYNIAKDSLELKRFIPEFFGEIECKKVIDEADKDISNQFHLSLAYKMRKVDGKFVKGGINDEGLNEAFRRAGIHHTKDASVLIDGNSIKCVVDIATKEHELWHQ